MIPTRHGNVRTVSEWPLCLVLVGCGAGLVLLLADGRSFRPGATVLGASMVVAAVLRAALSEAAAGLLAVRSRVGDVVGLALLGVAIIVLAQLVPLQS